MSDEKIATIPQMGEDSLFLKSLEKVISALEGQTHLDSPAESVGKVEKKFCLCPSEGKVNSDSGPSLNLFSAFNDVGGVSRTLEVPEKMKKAQSESTACTLPKVQSTLKKTTIKFKNEESDKSKAKKNLMLKLGNFNERATSLLQVINSMSSTNVVLVTSKKKAQSRRGPVSNKRSEYIGVSRNGPHWQSLITIKKRKTYIGSYRDERDAALAFDFYSLLLHSLTAKTNFDYTKQDILLMIENFKSHDGKFKPEILPTLEHSTPRK